MGLDYTGNCPVFTIIPYIYKCLKPFINKKKYISLLKPTTTNEQ
jgi:hypothetical protein